MSQPLEAPLPEPHEPEQPEIIEPTGVIIPFEAGIEKRAAIAPILPEFEWDRFHGSEPTYATGAGDKHERRLRMIRDQAGQRGVIINTEVVGKARQSLSYRAVGDYDAWIGPSDDAEPIEHVARPEHIKQVGRTVDILRSFGVIDYVLDGLAARADRTVETLRLIRSESLRQGGLSTETWNELDELALAVMRPKALQSAIKRAKMYRTDSGSRLFIPASKIPVPGDAALRFPRHLSIPEKPDA